MNLKNNTNWATAIKEQFTTSDSFVINNEKCNVDYSFKTTNNVLIGYGFDLHNEEIDETQIFSFLQKDKLTNGDSSLMTKIFKFDEYLMYHNTLIVFLVSKEKIFYLPNGIRQTNQFYWKSTNNINEFIEFLNQLKKRVDITIREDLLRQEEGKNPIRIEDLSKIYNELQIKAILKRPLSLEKSKYEQIPSDIDNKQAKKKHITITLTRMCVINNYKVKGLKIKVDLNNSIYIYDSDNDFESTLYDETKYFIINELGEFESSNLVTGETYSILKF